MNNVLWWARSFFLNYSTWYLALIIAIVVVGILTYRHLKKRRNINPAVWTILTFFSMLVATIVFIVTVNSIVSSSIQQSGVDASPIARLSEEQTERIEEVIAQLKHSDFIWNPIVNEFPNNATLIREYRGGWFDEDIPFARTHMGMAVTVYSQESRAVERMQLVREPYTKLIFQNNTEIVLRYPIMPVGSGSWYFPNNERWTISYIRMENVVIQLWETRLWHDSRDNISSQFIALLVDMLQGN
jgi:heme/copper-type cytochrome/quinol oxidase subunit 2